MYISYDYKLEKLFFNTPQAELHLQFCGNVSSVANKASIAATLGELTPIADEMFHSNDKILAPH